ncbi:MAG: Pr6Pr family membrane protein [Agathobacter sp.]|uniref:Pr6Pr family membrane protein n=1 Tax=Agathobacter sp. TaxID=2021311 RepID=UPI002585FFB3|nr:Pr6Pr family membrane protein [Agathobacter sp.]MCR5676908.1 Pr6Pr family membrane protein [Agathobacter sp.]
MNQISATRARISYVLKLIVFLSATIGTFLSAYAGRHSFMGGRVVFMYFTIQSNLAIAVICLIGAILMQRRRAVSQGWYVIQFVGTVSITLTGVVFGFVLAPTLGADAWNTQNTLTHLVVPLVAVVDYFVSAYDANMKGRNVFWVIVPPLLYAIYAGIGYVRGWQFAEGIRYPYFFLNWGSPAGAFGFSRELPLMGSAWWILLLLLFLVVVGFVYWFIANAIAKKFSR